MTGRAKYHGLFGDVARRRCPHSNLDPIYGDQIIAVGWWRLFCRDCRRFIGGPVRLAESRADESRAALTEGTDNGRH